MRKITLVGLVTAVIVLGLTFSPLTQYETHAAMEGKMMDKMMEKPVSIKGDLTAPKGDKPFGGDVVGNYIVKAKGHKIRIIAKVDKEMMEKMMGGKMMENEKMENKTMGGKMMEGKVLEGWLVDVQSGYKLSLGELEGNTLVFTQKMVNPWIYDLLVITEEPENDTDPSPNMPIGGTQLAEPLGQ